MPYFYSLHFGQNGCAGCPQIAAVGETNAHSLAGGAQAGGKDLRGVSCYEQGAPGRTKVGS